MAIKVSELRPCDHCGGPIAPMFYVVRLSLALIDHRAVNEFMGMHQFFGGRAPVALVENFAPSAADAVLVAGDKEPSLMTECWICQDCYLGTPLNLARLTESRHARTRKEDHMPDPETTERPDAPDPNPPAEQESTPDGESAGNTTTTE
jgi:hypothetical protein